MDCERNCKVHYGKIHFCKVNDPYVGVSWGNFYLCEKAIRAFRQRSLEVKIIDKKMLYIWEPPKMAVTLASSLSEALANFPQDIAKELGKPTQIVDPNSSFSVYVNGGSSFISRDLEVI